MTSYIAHDNNAIYGVGDTPNGARADARQWVDADAPLTVTRCTDTLARRVRAAGGDVAWTVDAFGVADVEG